MNYGMDYQGGDGAYGGGGFSTGGDAYGNASSQNSGGGAGAAGGAGGAARRNYDEQSVIPVTARMILAARSEPGDATQLRLEDDRKLHHVKIVGAIRGCEPNSTSVIYQLEDGTGLVDIKQWLDESDCTAQQEIRQSVQKDHIYVKVVGQIKEYNGSRSLLASSIRPLSTGNELTHHFLEVVYSGEKYKHNSTIVQPTSPMMGVTMNQNMGGVGFGGGGSGRTPLMAHGGGGAGDALKDAVLNYIKEHGEMSDVGASIQSCIKFLSHYSEAEIRTAVDHFAAEGMIYSTVNDDNFKFAL